MYVFAEEIKLGIHVILNLLQWNGKKVKGEVSLLWEVKKQIAKTASLV